MKIFNNVIGRKLYSEQSLAQRDKGSQREDES